MKGPAFIALHGPFDDVAERVEEHCDLLAERVVALGGPRTGRLASRLPPAVAPGTTSGRWRAGIASARQVAAAAAAVRGAIQESAGLGDPATSDLFTEVSRALDKDLWFLAHLQGRRTRPT